MDSHQYTALSPERLRWQEAQDFRQQDHVHEAVEQVVVGLNLIEDAVDQNLGREVLGQVRVNVLGQQQGHGRPAPAQQVERLQLESVFLENDLRKRSRFGAHSP